MVARETVCLRRLAGGERSEIVRYDRFLGNGKVSAAALIEGWSARTRTAAAGRRHVLAIQDSSDINFSTTPARRRGLGQTSRGNTHGLVLHAMLALDADSDHCLGLVGGRIWTRRGRVETAHKGRALADKESARWLATAEQAKEVLAAAGMVTVVADRESDIYSEWARLPGPNFHLLTRVMQDRRLAGGGTLFAAGAGFAAAATANIVLRGRAPGERARGAALTLRFGPVRLRRPDGSEPGLAESVALSLIEVVERDPPDGVAPVHWRLLTTHAVADAATAWRIVGWYQQRWTIEQLFRVMKSQGLGLEDSQIESAERLIKLTAIAAHAAALTLQLVQARDGRSAELASLAFDETEIAALEALGPRVEGKTERQKNPHPTRSLAWASWIIAHLGGWDGYPSSRPPGPITFKHGLQYFQAFVAGWQATHV